TVRESHAYRHVVPDERSHGLHCEPVGVLGGKWTVDTNVKAPYAGFHEPAGSARTRSETDAARGGDWPHSRPGRARSVSQLGGARRVVPCRSREGSRRRT